MTEVSVSPAPKATSAQIAEWKKTKTIGIIGLGDMGQLYANKFHASGWK